MRGEEVLRADGYVWIAPVATTTDDFDTQGHLNNAAVGKLFNTMRVAYIRNAAGEWWGAYLRDNRRVVAAKEVHLDYQSEGFPGEAFVGAMRYVRRDGKAAILEQRIVEATTGRAVARAWAVQLIAHAGRAVDWPEEYFARIAAVEGRTIEHRPPPAARPPWGPPP